MPDTTERDVQKLRRALQDFQDKAEKAIVNGDSTSFFSGSFDFTVQSGKLVNSKSGINHCENHRE